MNMPGSSSYVVVGPSESGNLQLSGSAKELRGWIAKHNVYHGVEHPLPVHERTREITTHRMTRYIGREKPRRKFNMHSGFHG